MKRIIITIFFTFTIFVISSNAAMFSDIDGHWAQADINSLVLHGIIKGIDQNTFAPDLGVTREQFLKMLLISAQVNVEDSIKYQKTAEDFTVLETSPFTDVAVDRWSYIYIKDAMGKIILKEDYNGSFFPDKEITREEAAVWMSRALALSPSLVEFTDSADIADKQNVGAAAENGLINGFEDGSFRPKAGLTRAQAAAMLNRLKKLAVDKFLENAGEAQRVLSLTDVDMDKDSQNDEITVDTIEDGQNYVVGVNGAFIVGAPCYTENSQYYFIDVDVNDKFLELVVLETKDNELSLAIYRYTGADFYLLGYIESTGELKIASEDNEEWGSVHFRGDGTISANTGIQFVHTMLVRKYFAVNSKMRLEDVTGMYSTLGEYSNFVVTHDLTSSKSDSEHPAISLMAGYTGRIVKTDLKNWIYIEAANGQKGWIYIAFDKLIKGEFLSYYLDNLWYAG